MATGFALGLILAVLGAAQVAPQEDPTRCEQISATTFVLEGPVNAAMAECVRDRLAPTTTELVVDSGGGDIKQALDIAELLEPLTLTIRVRERCYSSCANYFLPLAERLIVEPGAAIVLHGGADPQFLQGEVERRDQRIRDIMRDAGVERAEAETRYEANFEGMRALIERQRAFAERHRVGMGWFLYREAGDRDVGRWLAGERGPKPHLFGWRLMLVEEPMIRSCLPEVQIEPFQQRLEAEFIDDPERYGRFRRAEGLRSLTLECAEPAGT
ncbi:hypothetical protein N0B44_21815 [Roseibacterium beibuensis]|uniref:hypothetical protein n=1 Tax=[Roseibacterium] beibuensis TaxID=1193142 RepID=UPI00217E8108|nr:hypothetical protein [Roseibacterium beibuensis]MCS6625553.1 hypothetical protein [Roseibacterium beibuensis]